MALVVSATEALVIIDALAALLRSVVAAAPLMPACSIVKAPVARSAVVTPKEAEMLRID